MFARVFPLALLVLGTLSTGCGLESSESASDDTDDVQVPAVEAKSAPLRRRATFSGACVTEVKLDDLDANDTPPTK
jgi:hypothetical protein